MEEEQESEGKDEMMEERGRLRWKSEGMGKDESMRGMVVKIEVKDEAGDGEWVGVEESEGKDDVMEERGDETEVRGRRDRSQREWENMKAEEEWW